MTSFFAAVVGPIWIKFCRLVQNNMSTAVIWSKSKPDVEFQYGGHLGEFHGISSHSHLPHWRVLQSTGAANPPSARSDSAPVSSRQGSPVPRELLPPYIGRCQSSATSIFQPPPSCRTTTSSQHARPSGVLRRRSDGLECAAWRPPRPVAQCRQFPEYAKDASVSECTWTLSALEALRNVLYKFKTYLLTYLLAATWRIQCQDVTG